MIRYLLLLLLLFLPQNPGPSVTGTNAGGVLSANLIGWWPVNEGGAATVALDFSGNSNNGTWHGSKNCSGSYYSNGTPALSPFNYTGCFYNYSNYVLTTYASNLNITTNLTLSAWANFTARAACAEVISNLSPTNGYELIACGGMYFQVGNAGVYKSTPQISFTNGVWYHFCATYDGTAGTLYINGVPQSGPFSASSAIGSSTSAVTLGARPSGSQPMNGFIADARVYNSVQSCAALYAAGPKS